MKILDFSLKACLVAVLVLIVGSALIQLKKPYGKPKVEGEFVYKNMHTQVISAGDCILFMSTHIFTDPQSKDEAKNEEPRVFLNCRQQ